MSTAGSTTNSAEQPVEGSCLATQPRNSAGQHVIPIFEVAFRNGMWWSIPVSISTALYEKYTNNEDAGYTWDWGDTRSGSWRPDGEQTRINRYVIDFRAWEQRNIDNNRMRSVRLVWVTAETVDPKWSGQITSCGNSAAQPVQCADR
jgi:hypothetical protein